MQELSQAQGEEIVGQLSQTYAWSESRLKCLRECQWRYHLTYHVSWNGWLASAPQEKQRAYMLKNMTSLPMWIGSIVHDIIEGVITYGRETGEWRTLQESQNMAVQQLRKGWKQSVEKRWQGSPKYNVNLSEHFYQDDIDKEKINGYKQKVLRSLKAFYDMPLFTIMKELPKDAWLSLEEFQIFSLDTGEEVTLKIDCAFMYEGKVYLIDWKTGRVSESVIDQLVTYSMYAMKKGWAKSADDIIIVPAYLAAYEEIGDKATPYLEVTMDNMKRQAGIIRDEYPLLTKVFANKDNDSYFKHTDNERACKFCFFRDMCSGAVTTIEDGATPF